MPVPLFDTATPLAITDYAATLDWIDATVAAHPRLERVLGGARDGHAAHVALLSDAVPDEARSAAASDGSADWEVRAPSTP